jgi:hypothetical protein
MVVLFETMACPGCGHIRDTLDALCIHHSVVLVTEGEPVPIRGSQPEAIAPVLLDEGKLFVGHGGIESHLDDLTRFMALWEQFQTDACYCDDEGNVL